MSPLGELSARFAIADRLRFVSLTEDFIVAVVTTPEARARIALQGAHVMDNQIGGAAPLIWLSQEARFAPGKSIRGGVPVSCPWFGPHASDAREIVITSTGSRSTVFWTPWAEKAAKMGDFGADGWKKGMLCVENANAADDVVQLAPGETHCLAAQFRSTPLR